nr:MAG TPA: hypothetical protein [Caudoviricetes sp.]DAL53637.1 MAG TPA_asm: hypothetical protein [Bacteriophage sp.]DAV33379.1 MAG TPA: hypothetical protein [Caudoviricetes sp.]
MVFAFHIFSYPNLFFCPNCYIKNSVVLYSLLQ